MPRYVVLLRAVNVGGTGKLPMADLRTLCTEAGFSEVRTYIASGNVVLSSPESSEKVQSIMEDRLLDYAGKPVGVFVRTARQMQAIASNNPFPDTPPNKTAVVFLDHPPATDARDQAVGVDQEEIRLGEREIYIYYPDGMGRSKLRIPDAQVGTARNLNTVAKLVEMVGA